MYVFMMVSVMVFVYMEDSVSWVLGFGFFVLVNILGLFIFVMGNWFYCYVEVNGSFFIGLVWVIVVVVSKMSVFLLIKVEDYY